MLRDFAVKMETSKWCVCQLDDMMYVEDAIHGSGYQRCWCWAYNTSVKRWCCETLLWRWKRASDVCQLDDTMSVKEPINGNGFQRCWCWTYKTGVKQWCYETLLWRCARTSDVCVSWTTRCMSKMRSMTVVFRDVDVEHTRQVWFSDVARFCCEDENEQVMCVSVRWHDVCQRCDPWQWLS